MRRRYMLWLLAIAALTVQACGSSGYSPAAEPDYEPAAPQQEEEPAQPAAPQQEEEPDEPAAAEPQQEEDEPDEPAAAEPQQEEAPTAAPAQGSGSEPSGQPAEPASGSEEVPAPQPAAPPTDVPEPPAQAEQPAVAPTQESLAVAPAIEAPAAEADSTPELMESSAPQWAANIQITPSSGPIGTTHTITFWRFPPGAPADVRIVYTSADLEVFSTVVTVDDEGRGSLLVWSEPGDFLGKHRVEITSRHESCQPPDVSPWCDASDTFSVCPPGVSSC